MQPAMLGDIYERRQGVKGGQARDTHARKLGDMKGSQHPNTKPDTPLGYVEVARKLSLFGKIPSCRGKLMKLVPRRY